VAQTVVLLTVGPIMDQNSDSEIELYEEIIWDVWYNSPQAQAPGQKLAVSCLSDLRPALGSY